MPKISRSKKISVFRRSFWCKNHRPNSTHHWVQAFWKLLNFQEKWKNWSIWILFLQLSVVSNFERETLELARTNVWMVIAFEGSFSYWSLNWSCLVSQKANESSSAWSARENFLNPQMWGLNVLEIVAFFEEPCAYSMIEDPHPCGPNPKHWTHPSWVRTARPEKIVWQGPTAKFWAFLSRIVAAHWRNQCAALWKWKVTKSVF